MHCERVCEAILGRLGVSGGVAVGIAWAGGRRGRRRAGGGLAAWVVAPFRLPRNALCHSCFPPACGAGLQNGRRWRAKRALRQPETGLVAWPCGGVAPGRRCAGSHPVGPWPPCAGAAAPPERRFCNFFAGGCKFFPKKFWRFGKSDYLCTRLQEARALSSAGLEHLPYKQRVGGSNPSAPTTEDSAPHPGWQNLFLCPGKFYLLFFG